MFQRPPKAKAEDGPCNGPTCTGTDGLDWCCPFTDWICCEESPDACGVSVEGCQNHPDPRTVLAGNGLIADRMFRPVYARKDF